MQIKHNGFTLFEVLISIFIAGVAVLGLIKLELVILRASQSSFNYTIAVIEANNFADTVWMNLCAIEADPNKYSAAYSTWKALLVAKNYSGATLTNSDTLTRNDEVIVTWQDARFSGAVETENNKVTLLVEYPDFSGKCL